LVILAHQSQVWRHIAELGTKVAPGMTLELWGWWRPVPMFGSRSLVGITRDSQGGSGPEWSGESTPMFPRFDWAAMPVELWAAVNSV